MPNGECQMKIVINGPTTPEEVPGITAIANEVELVCAPNKERLAEVLPGADILLGWNFQSRDMSDQWHKADSLKWVHWCGAAVDRILSPELRASDITLTNARGIFDSVMAEYVLGYMISELKLFRETWHLQKERRWQTRLKGKLAGSRAVIFGVGSIGRQTARLLRSVGVKVSGVGRRVREDDPDFGTIYSSDRAFEAIEDADWVIGLLPLTEETTLYYGANFFGAMKQEARFMNLGRGGVGGRERPYRKPRTGQDCWRDVGCVSQRTDRPIQSALGSPPTSLSPPIRAAITLSMRKTWQISFWITLPDSKSISRLRTWSTKIWALFRPSVEEVI